MYCKSSHFSVPIPAVCFGSSRHQCLEIYNLQCKPSSHFRTTFHCLSSNSLLSRGTETWEDRLIVPSMRERSDDPNISVQSWLFDGNMWRMFVGRLISHRQGGELMCAELKVVMQSWVGQEFWWTTTAWLNLRVVNNGSLFYTWVDALPRWSAVCWS